MQLVAMIWLKPLNESEFTWSETRQQLQHDASQSVSPSSPPPPPRYSNHNLQNSGMQLRETEVYKEAEVCY
ncbi:hypothetical protein Pmani_003585 [Petrolisthes manimaculis]|uniref:Uncharacterized protein n=1 Tax=Petrolisthes manimaculis TaxID=1843537 RepID=A0AAE1UMD5_9EUCA|nr:hypothetical protein Pmani_003585 [Petrolisthes manimaculis]